MIAENYCLAGDRKNALDTLHQVNEAQREAFWHYRYSQALLLPEGEIEAALEAVEKAISMQHDSRFDSAFYRHKGQILNAQGDARYITYMKLAWQKADTEKFKEQILQETEKLSGKSASEVLGMFEE